MITLEKSKLSWHESTFLHNSNRIAFQTKYKKWGAKLIIKHGMGLWYNLINDDHLGGIVTDWHSTNCTLSLTIPSGGTIAFNFHQPVGLCSSVILSSPAYFTKEVDEFLNDFLYLMGYTNLFISIHSMQSNMSSEMLKETLPKWGYEPYIQLNNRRTQRDLILYTKTLKAWLF